MRQSIKLLLLSLSFILLAACQNSEVVEDPNPVPPTQAENRLSTSDFATAKTLFEEQCQGCHSGGIAPDFNGHLPTFTKVENGKTHLINALLFGMKGLITVNGQEFGESIAMANRSGDFDDSEIALLLNYGLTAWDNSDLLPEDFTLITAAEVAQERQNVKTPDEVYTARQTLQLP